MNLDSALFVLGLTKSEAALALRVLWRVGMAVFMLWALGAFAAIGLPGFVHAADIDIVKADQTKIAMETRTIRAELIEAQLITTRIRHCESPANSAARRHYWQLLTDLKGRYYALNGRAYDLPECTEL